MAEKADKTPKRLINTAHLPVHTVKMTRTPYVAYKCDDPAFHHLTFIGPTPSDAFANAQRELNLRYRGQFNVQLVSDE